MKKCIGFLLLLLVLQQLSAQKPLPPNIFYKKLPNGLDVLVVEDNSVPLATIEVAVKNGAYTESPEFNGLSHLYEHMFFKANKDYRDQPAFFQRLQELGISMNANTSDEMVNYYFTLPSYNLTEGLQVMNSALLYPAFNKSEIKRENIVVDAEFQRHESNPTFVLNDAMNHCLWGDLYSRKNTIGNHEIINTATTEKMTEIKNKYYWPNNSLIIVAGDVKHEDAFGQVQNIFGPWQASGFDPFEKYPVPEMKPLLKNDYFIIENANAQVPIISMQWQGPDTRNDVWNTYVADIFSFILQQNSSRLHKALVDAGLALQVNTGYLTEKYSGPIGFFVVPNPSKIKECFEVLRQQLDALDSDDYFTDEQLTISKRTFEIRQMREQEVTSQFGHVLAYWWCSASIDYFNSYLDNLNKVTRKDIQNYVRKYIKNKPHCAGMLLNPETRRRITPENFFKADLKN